MSNIELIEMAYPDVLFKKMDGFDDCVVGVVERFGQEPCLAYDRAKIIKKMVERHGMTESEAMEFYEYNQLGAYVGSTTPAFIVFI